MPRRFLATRRKAQSAVGDRLRSALVYDIQRPRVEDLIGSPDQKLQIVKSSLASAGGPPKLVAALPEILALPEDFAVAHSIVTVENPFAEEKEEDSLQTGGGEIDFTRIEDFFRLETKIDARNDHSLLKLALASKSGSFMFEILNSFTLPSERLAFIQQQSQVGEGGSMLHPPLVAMGNMSGIFKDKELVISCQVCGEMFNALSRFQRHVLTHPDPEQKKFLCLFCGKRFNRADHLNRHTVLHGDVLHKCLMCGEEFDRASHLDRHRRKNHPPAGQAPSQTPPLTPRGPLNSSSSVDLDSPGLVVGGGTNLHLLAAVATPEDSLAMDQQQLDPVQVVSQILKSDSILAEQQQGGNSKPPEVIDRPYMCDVCGRKFIRSTHLRRHMRIHTGEKPFSCHICGRSYARGDYLRAHINAHRRDRVHRCKHCSEIFHDLTRFADHCRVMHKGVIMEDDFGPMGQSAVTLNHSQMDGFSIYEDISLTALDATGFNHDGVNYPEAVSIVSVASENPSAKESLSMSGFTAQDLANPFHGTDFLQAFGVPGVSANGKNGSQSDSHHVILQNGALTFSDAHESNGSGSVDSGHEVTIGNSAAISDKALLDPLTHIMMNSEALDVLHGHTH